MDKLIEQLPEKMSFRQIRFKLEAAGFDQVKQLGNHAKFVRRRGSEISTAILPHYQEIPRSTLRSILCQAGITKEQFDSL